MLAFFKIAFNRYGWVPIVAALVWMYAIIMQGQVDRLQVQLEDAQQNWSVAQQQLELSAVTISVLEATANAQQQISTIADEAVEVIEEAPNADELVPPDVALAWANGIERLRASPGTDLADNDYSTDLVENRVREAGDAFA